MSRLQPPLMAGWMATPSVTSTEQAVSTMNDTAVASARVVSPRINPFSSNQVGVRPHTTVTRAEDMQLYGAVGSYAYCCRSLALACNEHAAQLEKVKVWRQQLFNDLADFSDEICSKIDHVQVLEKQIDMAISEEIKANVWLKDEAKRRGLV